MRKKNEQTWKRMNRLEDSTMEITEIKEQKEKRLKNEESPGTCGTSITVKQHTHCGTPRRKREHKRGREIMWRNNG